MYIFKCGIGGLPRYEPVFHSSSRRKGASFHLPDKEFRYLRTVIVTAAVYRGFGSELPPPFPKLTLSFILLLR